MKTANLNFTRGKIKKTAVFLLLTVFLIFLLNNTKVSHFILVKWYEMLTVLFSRDSFDLKTTPRPSEVPRRSTTSTIAKPAVIQRCSYKYLSPENAVEGRRLLDSITWPEIPPLPKPFSLNLTTNIPKSSFTIVPRSGGWRVGDELTVTIQLRDFNGNPKKSGGDYLISKLHNRKLGAGVVGQVQDHLNGTFTALFPLLWNGTADIEVTLVHPSESITVLQRLTEEQPDRIFFGSHFKSGLTETQTTCNVCLDSDKQPVCNFTDVLTGEQWFCYKPPTLDCSTRVSNVKRGIEVKASNEDKSLFQKGINLKSLIKALGENTITILPNKGESKNPSPGPSGYYFGDVWTPLAGPEVQQFNGASAMTACLNGKQLHMFGDSTVRQFYEFITKNVPNLLTFDKHSSPQCGPLLAIDHANDIMIGYRGHGPPFRSYRIELSQMRYVANELDRLSGGPNTVVVIGVWAHFPTFPMEVYYQRLMTIRRAVQRLLQRAPGTTVIVRTGNLKDSTQSSLTDSDWYALQLDKVLRAVFKDSGVVLLEAWEMVQAHYLPHNVHPPPPIIKLMVDFILSQACPKKR